MSQVEFFKRLPLFQDMDDREMNALMMVLRRKDFPEGAALIEEGGRRTGLLVLVSGKVGFYKTLSEGRQERLGEGVAGQVVGGVSMLDGFPRAMTARAETPVVAVEFPHADFDQIMSQHGSKVAFKLLARLTEDASNLLRQVNKQVADLGPPPSQDKKAGQTGAHPAARATGAFPAAKPPADLPPGNNPFPPKAGNNPFPPKSAVDLPPGNNPFPPNPRPPTPNPFPPTPRPGATNNPFPPTPRPGSNNPYPPGNNPFPPKPRDPSDPFKK